MGTFFNGVAQLGFEVSRALVSFFANIRAKLFNKVAFVDALEHISSVKSRVKHLLRKPRAGVTNCLLIQS